MFSVSCGVALYDEHRVAEREESVSFINGVLINAHYLLTRGEGGNEHEQDGFGQVKIGYKRIHRFELIAGGNENIGPSAARVHDAVIIGGAFESTAARGAYDMILPPARLAELMSSAASSVICQNSECM